MPHAHILPRISASRRVVSWAPGLLLSVGLVGLVGLVGPVAGQAQDAMSPTPPVSVVTATLREGLDTAVSACVDFDRYANGGWRARTSETIPFFGATTEVSLRTAAILQAMLDSAHRVAASTTDPVLRTLGYYYGSCLAIRPEKPVFIVAGPRIGVGDTSRVAQCIGSTVQVLGGPLGHAFVRRVHTPAAAARAQQLLTEVKVATAERLRRGPWMSAEMQERALNQLAAMTLRIGAPDYKPEQDIDYAALQVSPTDYEQNMRVITSLQFRQAYKTAGAAQWWSQMFQAGGSYSYSFNVVSVPVVMFLPPFFDLTSDAAFNYVGVVHVIAHEIHHGLTQAARAGDSEEFRARAARLQANYSALPPVEGVRVSGGQTFNENMADLGGLMAVYDAWQRNGRTTAPARVEGFTPEQRFFLAYARIWRELWTEQWKALYRSGVHAPGFARINGVLRNMPAFAEAFGCKAGDPMVLPAPDRADLW